MTAVDHYHLEASTLCKTGHTTVGCYDVINKLFGERLDLYAVFSDRIARPPLVQLVLLSLIGHICSGKLTGMRQLYAGDRAMTTYCVGRICGAGKGV